MSFPKVVHYFLLTFFMWSYTNCASAQVLWNWKSVRIQNDDGGDIEVYAKRYERLRDAGVRIEIDGRCYSACTMILGIIPKDRVCITQSADFGFHSTVLTDEKGRTLSDNDWAATHRLVKKYYPRAVRDWIERMGGLPNAAITHRLLHLKGTELMTISGYRHCNVL